MRRASGHLDGRHHEVTGDGPVPVFAHGLGGSHMSWWRQAAHFAPRFTCVTLAHQGFRTGAPVPGGPTPHGCAADLAALADHLSAPPFVLVAQFRARGRLQRAGRGCRGRDAGRLNAAACPLYRRP